MVPGTEYRVILHIAQEVVHPSHVPLEIEAQAVVLHGSRHFRPGRGLLRDEKGPVFALLIDRIQMLQELDGLQVLLAAIDIRHPLSVIFSIIQIQHGSHRVHADAVRVVHLRPVQGVGDQEILHLGTAVIVDQRSPVGVAALAGIEMLIQAGAVEGRQPEGIPRKMSRHPVQDHADALAVHIIHKIHEILRRAIARGGRVVACHLIAPGLVQRMLHDRHQLHMGIAHILHIVRQHGGNLTIIIKLPGLLCRSRSVRPRSLGLRGRFLPGFLFLRGGSQGAVPLLLLGLSPGPQMHLVNQKGLFLIIRLLSLLQPALVRPGKTGQIRDHRRRMGPELRSVRVRVRLQHRKAALCLNLIFIAGSRSDSRDEKLKNARFLDAAHGMPASVPEIEISHHADAAGVRGPDRKICTLHALDGHGMGSHLLIQGIVDARLEFVQILRRIHLRLEPVGVLQILNDSIVIFHAEKIFRNRLARKQDRKEAAVVRQLHLILFSRTPDDRRHLHRRRQKSLDQNPFLRLVRTENLLGLILFRVHQCLDPGPIHKLIQPVIHTLLLLLRSEAHPPYLPPPPQTAGKRRAVLRQILPISPYRSSARATPSSHMPSVLYFADPRTLSSAFPIAVPYCTYCNISRSFGPSPNA